MDYEFRLYRIAASQKGVENGNAWTENYRQFKDINLMPMNSVHQFEATRDCCRARDWATHIAYRLPVGTVVTLVDDLITDGAKLEASDYEFENQIRFSASIDLIGTGELESIWLDPSTYMKLAGWAWYTYDVNLGYLQLFTGVNYGGQRTVLFPSRFNPDQVYPFGRSGREWFMHDKLASIDWSQLDTTVRFDFMNNMDGSGLVFKGVDGRRNSVVLSNTPTVPPWFPDLSYWPNTANSFSSFRWSMAAPLSVVFAQLTIPATSLVVNDKSLRKTITVEHTMPVESVVTIAQEQSFTKRTSISSTKSLTKAWSLEVSLEAESVMVTASATAGVSGSSTQESTNSNEKEEVLTASESHQVTLPAEVGTWRVTSVIPLLEVKPTTLTFSGAFSYDFPVKGGTNTGSNVWTRTLQLEFTFSGNYVSSSQLRVEPVI